MYTQELMYAKMTIVDCPLLILVNEPYTDPSISYIPTTTSRLARETAFPEVSKRRMTITEPSPVILKLQIQLKIN